MSSKRKYLTRRKLLKLLRVAKRKNTWQMAFESFSSSLSTILNITDAEDSWKRPDQLNYPFQNNVYSWFN